MGDNAFGRARELPAPFDFICTYKLEDLTVEKIGSDYRK